MARMGHDSERAAMIYQHKARGADKAITDAIDALVRDEQDQGDDSSTGTAGYRTLMARPPSTGPQSNKAQRSDKSPDLPGMRLSAFSVEKW
jgi:hypothetical protein